jgi:4-hydroxy-4-methyl-2-oxoglutarate aldolase
LKKIVMTAFCALMVAAVAPVKAQVKTTREQILFYTSGWKGERFPDGRPKISDSVVERAKNVTMEDLWDFLSSKGYHCQYENGWQALHVDQPMSGRALTAQYMPARPDMTTAIKAEGKAEGRTGGNNMWPINELQNGDVYVADGFGKIVEGTLIGSNLGSGIAAHSHTGFVFDAGIRDVMENREIPNMNGFYRASDPSAWKGMRRSRSGSASILRS